MGLYGVKVKGEKKGRGGVGWGGGCGVIRGKR